MENNLLNSKALQPPLVLVSDLSRHVSSTVCVKGWVYNQRSSGKICFILLRDGTGICQCVLAYSEHTQTLFHAFEKLAQESSIEIQGKVKKWKDSFEIEVSDLKILSLSKDYPISKKEHGIDFLMNRRHLWLRSKRTYAVLRIRHFVIQAIHSFFNKKQFTQIDPPVFTPTACEGASTLFKVAADFTDSLYLSQSGQLYLEAASAGFNRVYCLNPAFRAEKSSTRRHLMEFWMCEAEMAFCSLNQNMDIIEEMIIFIIQYVLQYAGKDLKSLKKDTAFLEKIKKPFPRIHYKEACQILIKKQPQFKIGSDFGGADETILSSEFEQPLFIHHYPKDIKAFYMKSDSSDLSLSCDLLAPQGYGELVGGGQREDCLQTLEAAAQKRQLEGLEWYLDLRKHGSFAHSGFGLGLERLICWICGLDHVREAIPFPRVYGRKFFENSP